MSVEKKVALVVGALGVIGKNLAEYLASPAQSEHWEVLGLSRRVPPEVAPAPGQAPIHSLSVDLLDPVDVRRKIEAHPLGRRITHVFYAAYQDRPTWAELVAPNVTMLVNVVDAVEALAPGLEHVSLMQGYKVYGAHLGPFKTPARESDPGHMPPEFNVDQQTFLEKRQEGKSWSWSAIRPSVVGGFALGNPMNLVNAIAVYAAISKRHGLPLRFPGKPGAYDKLLEMTDAGLLARATVWAATAPRARNQAFNVNNGDLFRWNEMWPKIARFFDMEVAPPLPMSLDTIMSDKKPEWETMIRAHDLAPTTWEDVSSWRFADFVFSWDYDMFADGSKLRRFGFHEFVDTEEMFMNLFSDLRARKIIP